jgi:glutathione S-transferase
MALTIYGSPMSRTFRVIWMAKELGLQYENVPLDPRKGEPRSPDFLKINPNGHVPAIKDGDFVMWESLAINMYLARKHGGPLCPTDAEEVGKAAMWSIWALTELENNIATMVQQAVGMPIDAATGDKAKEAVKAPLTVLNNALASGAYLVGGRFTVADLNVAGVVSGLGIAKYDLAPWPKVSAWLQTCASRKAFAEAMPQMGR